MAQHPSKLVSTAGEKVARGGKIIHVNIAKAGDSVFELREVNVSGAIKYQVDCAVAIPHTDLNIPYKTALYVKVQSGTTGAINIVHD